VQSWSCGGDDAHGDSVHGGDGVRPMSGAIAEGALEGLVQDRRGNQNESVAAGERAVQGHVVVAVAVELHSASVAAVVVAVVVAVDAVAVAAVACDASSIPFRAPSARSPLSHAHRARTWSHHDARFLSLASSH
jgi:hypothetical protein